MTAHLRRITAADPGVAEALATLLVDTVEGGASVGFLAPLGRGEALAWAHGVLADLGPGLRLWLAEDAQGQPLGTVQLAPCLRANGRHRGEVQKLFVHRRARGQRTASLLMQAAQDEARTLGLTLLVLDTQAGSAAESVYRHLGWQGAGSVPGYALSPYGTAHATAYFYKPI